MNELPHHISLHHFRKQVERAIVTTLRDEPSLTYPQVAAMYMVSRSQICLIAKRHGIRRVTGRKPKGAR